MDKTSRENEPLLSSVESNDCSTEDRLHGTFPQHGEEPILKKDPPLITVEPGVFLYFLAYSPIIPYLDQYIYARMLQDHNITEVNSTLCEANMSDSSYDIQQELQSHASQWVMYLTLAFIVPGFFSTILLGSYSDKAGRKIAIILPTLGALLRMTIMVINVGLNGPMWVFLIAAAADGVLGGVSTLIMGTFAYIADVTTLKQRSFRIVVVEVSLGVANIASYVGIGFLISNLGYFYPVVIMFGLFVLTFFYFCFGIKESIARKQDAEFFTLSHFVNTAKPFIKNDSTNRRWKLQVAIAVMGLNCLDELGSGDVINLFMLNSPLCFSSILIGLFGGGQYLVRYIACMGSVGLCQGCLGDTGLMLLGAISSSIYYVFMAMVTSKLMMFLAPFAGMFSLLVIPMVRTTMSKLAKDTEQGAIFASIALAQLVFALIGSLTLNTVYSQTVKVYTFHGIVFFVMAGIGLICAGLVGWLHMGMRNSNLNEYNPTVREISS